MANILDFVNIIVMQAEQSADTVNTTAASNLPKPTPEGRYLAYASLIVMAVFPIILGSFKSVDHLIDQKNKARETGEVPETMTQKDAMIFPITASCTLGGIYLFIKAFSKEYVNMLITSYFVLLGVYALFTVLRPIVQRINVLNKFNLRLCRNKVEDNKLLPATEDMINWTFNTADLMLWLICAAVGAWYCHSKHWISNNIFAIAFSISGIELLSLNTVTIGFILLLGLFIYDVFWVFGTNVMVTVAKSFEAPIKLLFPHDFLIRGIFGQQFAMLGLGDIVIPGIFIALLLRFDDSLKKNSRTYFYTSLIAYITGLIVTVAVMTIFEHAQPALLYLVPACTICPLTVAVVKGELKDMLAYADHHEAPASKEKSVEEKSQ